MVTDCNDETRKELKSTSGSGFNLESIWASSVFPGPRAAELRLTCAYPCGGRGSMMRWSQLNLERVKKHCDTGINGCGLVGRPATCQKREANATKAWRSSGLPEMRDSSMKRRK